MIARPELLVLLLLLIPVIIIISRQYSRAKLEFGKFKNSRQPHSLYDVFFIKWFFSALSFCLFIAFSILSLAGFYLESRIPVDVPSEIDIVFALDISYSMLCEDIAPSRLYRSIGVIKGIMDNLPGQRYSLVVFKGQAAVSVPMTENIEAINSTLGYLSPAMLSASGTNLEQALYKAVQAFPGGADRREEILLFSDGEAQAGNINTGITQAVKNNIRVHTFATGSSEGGVIPLPNGEVLTFEGREVITSLDKKTLNTIAEETNGIAYSITEPGLVTKVVKDVGEGVGYEGQGRQQKEWYRFFLGASLIFLFFHTIVRIYPWKNIL